MSIEPIVPKNSTQTRRQFIKQSTALAGGASLGLGLSSRLVAQSLGANDRVVFGLIGCGTMGRENMRHFLQLNQPVAAFPSTIKALPARLAARRNSMRS